MIALPAFLIANWRLIAAGAALVTVFGMGWEANGWRLQRELAETRAEHSRQVSEAAQAREDEERAQRAVEASREAAKQEITRVANIARTHLEDSRRIADGAGRGVRDAAAVAATAASKACQDPATGGSGKASPDAADLLADLLGVVESAGRLMAEEADRSRLAAEACAASYDALTR